MNFITCRIIFYSCHVHFTSNEAQTTIISDKIDKWALIQSCWFSFMVHTKTCSWASIMLKYFLKKLRKKTVVHLGVKIQFEQWKRCVTGLRKFCFGCFTTWKQDCLLMLLTKPIGVQQTKHKAGLIETQQILRLRISRTNGIRPARHTRCESWQKKGSNNFHSEVNT